jgi:hypothetical protein
MLGPGSDGFSRALPAGAWSSPIVQSALTTTPDGSPAIGLLTLKQDGKVYPGFEEHANDEAVLLRFAALSEASDEAILRFTRRFGALDLCTHLYPLGRHPGVPVHPWRSCPLLVIQPTALYRVYAARISAALTLASAVRKSEPPSVARMELLNRPWPRVPRTMAPPDMGLPFGSSPGSRIRATFRIEGEVHRWLSVGAVVPAMRWGRGDRPTIELAGAGLWGAIARQLAFHVASIDRLAFCAGCGVPFVPSRRPKPKQDSWCSDLRCRKERQNRAQRESRRRRSAPLPRHRTG